MKNPKFIYLFFWWRLDSWSLSSLIRGIEPGPFIVRVHSPNHWTTKEVPPKFKFVFKFFYEKQSILIYKSKNWFYSKESYRKHDSTSKREILFMKWLFYCLTFIWLFYSLIFIWWISHRTHKFVTCLLI